MAHRRNGKVALLLDDGKTYAEIIQWLATNGFPGFNGENIRQWKNGDFQDWLNHHDELSESEKLRQMAMDVANKTTAAQPRKLPFTSALPSFFRPS